MKEIRTPRGTLVGKYDESTNVLSIKDGSKVTLIEVPATGLTLRYSPGDGIIEEIRVAPAA